MESSLEPKMNVDRLRPPNGTPALRLEQNQKNGGNALVFIGEQDTHAVEGSASASIVQATFKDFAAERNKIEQKVDKLIHSKLKPADAIHLAIAQKIRECFHTGLETDGAAQRAIPILNLFRQSRAGSTRPAQDTLQVTLHGVSLQIALFEVLPEVFQRTYREKPDKEILETLIPAGTKKFTDVLTKMSGNVAIAIEDEMITEKHIIDGKEEKYVGDRAILDASMLTLQRAGDTYHLDTTEELTDELEPVIREMHSSYYGCTAGLLKMNAGGTGAPNPTIFAYMTELIASLLKKHWFPQLLKKK